jgi:biopolymer transport protein ExbB
MNALEDTPVVGADAAALSLYEMLQRGGPVMVPIALCSVVALAFAVERALALRSGAIGGRAFARRLVDTLRGGGVRAALEACGPRAPVLGRIVAVGLERTHWSRLERDQAVGDTAATELARLAHNLRPLLVVYLVAPLLGLLGTVWGMIESFGEIATESSLGRPELLASGIHQALTTTAAGLAVAIPAIVVHHLLKGRIEGFARLVEETQRDVEAVLSAPAPTAMSSQPDAASPASAEAPAAPALRAGEPAVAGGAL